MEDIAKVHGVKKVLVAQHDAYKGFLPGRLSWGQMAEGLGSRAINQKVAGFVQNDVSLGKALTVSRSG